MSVVRRRVLLFIIHAGCVIGQALAHLVFKGMGDDTWIVKIFAPSQKTHPWAIQSLNTTSLFHTTHFAPRLSSI